MGTVLFSIIFVGIGSATTEYGTGQLYAVAAIYSVLSWMALAYTLLGAKELLRWAGLLVPLTPGFVLATSYVFEGMSIGR